MGGRVGERPAQIGVGHWRQKSDAGLRGVDHIQQPGEPLLERGQPGLARERIGHAITDHNHRRLDRQDLLPELFESRFRRVKTRPGNPSDGVTAPAQIAKDQILIGIADREQRLQVAIPLITLDQGVADEDDAIAVVQLEPRRLIAVRFPQRKQIQQPDDAGEKHSHREGSQFLQRCKANSGMVEQAGRWRWV